jgi:hydrogenase assembly chaperone HypC/HupF
MCIGIPMQVIEQGEFYTLCEGLGERKQIDMSLVGSQPVGTWLLTFLDAAREVIGDDDANKITEALKALDLAMSGETEGLDMFFADLSGREPQLPEHLK